MSSVVGIDFSSFAIDLVKLDETHNEASWTRVNLDGATAWDRTRKLPAVMPGASWWDDVYLCAVESPKSAGFKVATVMHRVQGSLLASIPAAVWTWEVTPAEWKGHLGIKANVKPGWGDIATKAPGLLLQYKTVPQDALDALGVALFARDTNQRAVDAA